MAMSFQNKLNDLEARLKAENDSIKRDRNPKNFDLAGISPRRTRPCNMFGDFTFGRPASPGQPTNTPPNVLNFNRPASAGQSGITSSIQCGWNFDKPASAGQAGDARSIQMRRKEFRLPMSSPPAPKPPDSVDIDSKYQEIIKQAGCLTLDGRKVRTDIHDLEQLGDLGHGTCGHVVKMRHRKTNHVMAVKQMRRSGNREENKRIIMDLDVVLKSHNCPYIVQCVGCFITMSDVWISMELMATCLEKLMKRIEQPVPEKILGKVAVATVNALHYLKEEHGVIHRDIKPSNILIDEKGRIKLCDFGISGRLVDSKAKTRSAGCAAYMAPERIDPPDPARPDYDIRADVWALGISLVELATGYFPYINCKTDFEVLTKVLQEDPPHLPRGRGFSMDFCSFVKDSLTKDYKRRPKYKKLMEHNFIKRYTYLNVDVATWYAEMCVKIEASTPQTPAYSETLSIEATPTTPHTPINLAVN